MATDVAAEIAAAAGDPEALETAYRRAKRNGQADAFAAEVRRRYEWGPGDVLMSAWFYRLATPEESPAAGPAAGSQAEPVSVPGRRINWGLAVSVSVPLALVYWICTSDRLNLPLGPPLLFLLWAPLAACALVVYLTLAAGRTRRDLWVAAPLLVLAAYAWWFIGQDRSQMHQYQTQMLLHLPLVAWAAVGLHLLGTRLDDDNRFAFLLKSAEVVLTGGVFFGAAGVFVAITVGLFSAIGIALDNAVMNAIVAAVAGLIPVLATAAVYDPGQTPAQQRFDQGLARLIGTVGRVFLPLTLLVGVVYILSIPANFARPFEQRDVLIVYNAMLFAVMGLMVICTPLPSEELQEPLQVWLRRGLILLAAMTVVVSLYAMAATVYRTALGGLTINRVTVIGWNGINIALLGVYLGLQFRAGLRGWLAASYRSFRYGMAAYALWTLCLVLVLPLLPL